MLAAVDSCVLAGLEARMVEVQADDGNGTPGFLLVGLAGTSVKEARERVRSAIKNSNLPFPTRRLTVNLAPAELRKQGSGLDLPIAVAVALAVLRKAPPPRSAFLGELALDGSVTHVDGVLVAARWLRRHGFERVFVPATDAAEAVLVEGLEVIPCTHLAGVVAHLMGAEPIEPQPATRPAPRADEGSEHDLAEVYGQEEARRALEVAAAGGHHLLLSGPPGAGKTMLARCLPGILPPLDLEEALEVAQVRSLLGDLSAGRPLEWTRPFRAPHHCVSMAGLIGGGSGLALPGEISRANDGVKLQPMTGANGSTAAGIYVRISSDQAGEALGVQRQEADCRERAAVRGWTVAKVYADNDLSAYSGKARPEYRRLLDDIRSGAIKGVVTWSTDRLYRRLDDLAEFVKVVDEAGCQVEAVKAGSLDFATAAGRMVATILGATAINESAVKSERQQRKHQELAAAGKDAGGGRPFGYEADRMTVRKAEAVLVREAARRALDGESLRSICRDWTARGVPTVTGAEWSSQVMRRMLASARISGRREYRARLRDIGKITCDNAVWPGIISPADSDRIRAILSDPERRKNTYAREYLLTGGIARCGLCGKPLVARPRADKRRSMVCASGPGFNGCGKIRVLADPVEALISEAVLIAIERGDKLRAAMSQRDDREATDGLLAIEAKLAELARDWAEDRIGHGEWEAARKALEARRAFLQRRVDAGRRAHDLDGLPDPLRVGWPALPLVKRRAIIQALIESVDVMPAVKGRNYFESSRIAEPRWKL